MLTSQTPPLQRFLELRYSAGGNTATRVFSQRVGAIIAWMMGRVGASPSAVTLMGCLVFIGGALMYAILPSGVLPLLLCAMVYQLGYAFDCADGQLARATGCSSAFGAWLDVACDHVRVITIHFAAAYWLVVGLDVGFGLAAAVAAAGATALSIKLHTLTVISSDHSIAPGPRSRRRQRALDIMDPPVFMLVLCLLRESPTWLTGYIVAMAALYLATAVALARRRLLA